MHAQANSKVARLRVCGRTVLVIRMRARPTVFQQSARPTTRNYHNPHPPKHHRRLGREGISHLPTPTYAHYQVGMTLTRLASPTHATAGIFGTPATDT